MNKPIPLSVARVEKSGDCREWSVSDCLRTVLDDIESGEIDPNMVFIGLSQPVEDRLAFPFYCAGGRTIEIQGLVAKHFHEQLRADT